MFIEGARWDSATMMLAESLPKVSSIAQCMLRQAKLHLPCMEMPKTDFSTCKKLSLTRLWGFNIARAQEFWRTIRHAIMAKGFTPLPSLLVSFLHPCSSLQKFHGVIAAFLDKCVKDYKQGLIKLCFVSCRCYTQLRQSSTLYHVHSLSWGSFPTMNALCIARLRGEGY